MLLQVTILAPFKCLAQRKVWRLENDYAALPMLLLVHVLTREVGHDGGAFVLG